MYKKDCEKGKETRQKIYDFLVSYIEKNNYAPTLREIGTATGLKSTATVYNQLHKLESMGVIQLGGYNMSRSIKVIADLNGCKVTNGWIKCNDRLPEAGKMVLTCDSKGNMHVFKHEDYYNSPFNISPSNPIYYQPVAWRPLPEPYKESEV